MVQLMILVLAATVLIRGAPALPLSRLLNEWLAVRPARWLLRQSRQELIAWTIAAVLIAFAGEFVLVIGGPQMAIGVAFDLAAYVDAAVAVATLASIARVRSVTAWLRPPARPRPRARTPRVSSTRTERSAANDGEDRPGALAA